MLIFLNSVFKKMDLKMLNVLKSSWKFIHFFNTLYETEFTLLSNEFNNTEYKINLIIIIFFLLFVHYKMLILHHQSTKITIFIILERFNLIAMVKKEILAKQKHATCYMNNLFFFFSYQEGIFSKEDFHTFFYYSITFIKM